MKRILFAPILFLMGCSEVSVIEEDPAPAPVVLPDGAAPPVDGCTSPNLVPRGFVWLGEVLVGPHGELMPWACGNKHDPMGTRRFTVGPVFLDADEARVDCYDACVQEGSCSPLDGEAVALDRTSAETFCAFRGGRLPSLAELQRAAQGEALSIGPIDIYEEWRTCYFADFAAAECVELQQHAYWGGPSLSRDVGPFGHKDLFGSNPEFTLSTLPLSDHDIDAYCNAADGADAPLSFSTSGRPLTFGPGFLLAKGGYYEAVTSNESPWGPSTVSNWFTMDQAEEAATLRGVRCAYDPAP